MPAQLRDPRTGATYPLDPGKPFVIGRGQGCDLRITDGTVARRHAGIQALPAESGVIWTLHDGGSTNGTFLNGEPIGHAVLRPGDVIRFAEKPPFVFETDLAPAIPPRPDAVPVRHVSPVEILHEAAAEVLACAGVEAVPGYRGAPVGREARNAMRRACGSARGSAAREALAALAALDQLDSGDLAGAFAALLAELDLGRAPSPLFTRLARYLIALSADRAGPILHRRASEMLAAGGDAVPYATLLAASGDDRAMFELRNEAGKVRDLGHPVGRAVLKALAEPQDEDWLYALRESMALPSGRVFSGDALAQLTARVSAAVRRGASADDAALCAEVIDALRATPAEDLEKRAALRRMLEDLTGQTRGGDPAAWLGG
ncbi:MAG: FHA domain-containing protein [Minicystis sp.]